MSVGANPTGIPPKVAQQVAAIQANRANQQANQANNTARTANAPRTNPLTNTAAPAPAVAASAPSAPAAARGGTTPATAPNTAQTLAAMAPATAFPGALAALGAIAVTTKGGRARGAGDAAQESGDVGVETQSEIQPDALQQSETEQATDVGAATNMSGPAT